MVFEQPHVNADIGFLGFLPGDVGEILVVDILYPAVDVLRFCSQRVTAVGLDECGQVEVVGNAGIVAGDAPRTAHLEVAQDVSDMVLDEGLFREHPSGRNCGEEAVALLGRHLLGTLVAEREFDDIPRVIGIGGTS